MKSALKTTGFLLKETVREWSEDGAASIAAALAYYAVFSLSPLLIIIGLVIGLFLGQDIAQSELLENAEIAVGEEGVNTFRGIIENAQNTSSSSLRGTIIWFSVIIWGASGLFTQLQSALNKIWEVQGMPGRSPLVYVKNRLLSFLVVLIASFLLLLALASNVVMNVIIQNLGETTLVNWLIRLTQLLVSLSLMTILFAMIFKILPDVIMQWRDVWVGAGFTAVLFMLGQLGVGFYLTNTDVGSVFGAAGSLTVILVWIYYSAQILLFGAEFTEVWARHHGAYIRPDEDAVWINEAQARREAEAAGIAFQE